MNDREFFLKTRAAEKAGFVKVLRALPADRLDYRPHERSPHARQIAWIIAAELLAACEAAEKGETSWKTVPPPPLEDMIALFEKQDAELARLVGAMDDAAWEKKVKLSFGGKVVMEPPCRDFLWMLLFDAIHHRGQLTAYIRPMGGKVPGVYGPSGDDKP
ncbi:MAG TPA: DinB family protein [Vicinamibacteria bacterium]|nr:DinB family protein [Vicinamibacteria bacterium]